jgi:hypothetical protein
LDNARLQATPIHAIIFLMLFCSDGVGAVAGLALLTPRAP